MLTLKLILLCAAVGHKRMLISATHDLHIALSWGYGGCHPIVAIDVAKAAAAGVRAYDMGGSLNDLCSAGMVQNFAASSREVVFDRDIPAHCVTLLQVGAALLQCWEGGRIMPHDSTNAIVQPCLSAVA